MVGKYTLKKAKEIVENNNFHNDDITILVRNLNSLSYYKLTDSNIDDDYSKLSNIISRDNYIILKNVERYKILILKVCLLLYTVIHIEVNFYDDNIFSKILNNLESNKYKIYYRGVNDSIFNLVPSIYRELPNKVEEINLKFIESLYETNGLMKKIQTLFL